MKNYLNSTKIKGGIIYEILQKQKIKLMKKIS